MIRAFAGIVQRGREWAGLPAELDAALRRITQGRYRRDDIAALCRLLLDERPVHVVPGDSGACDPEAGVLTFPADLVEQAGGRRTLASLVHRAAAVAARKDTAAGLVLEREAADTLAQPGPQTVLVPPTGSPAGPIREESAPPGGVKAGPWRP